MATHPTVPSTCGAPQPYWYEIRLEGRLEQRWSTWFDGMTLTPGPDGSVTVLRGAVADQAALHGVLARLRDLGVPLLSVSRVEPDPESGPRRGSTPSRHS